MGVADALRGPVRHRMVPRVRRRTRHAAGLDMDSSSTLPRGEPPRRGTGNGPPSTPMYGRLRLGRQLQRIRDLPP
eukprot:9657319-Heterocapsa_arctica.AAC.1